MAVTPEAAGRRSPGPATAGGLRWRLRSALRPLWRSIPFHARFRIRRALRPARWRASLGARRHRRDLQALVERNRGRQVVVIVPHQEWNDLFQRPQQLARALAGGGALVLYLTPGVRRDRRAGLVEVEPGLYLANVASRALAGLRPDVAILGWIPQRDLLQQLRPKKVVYDHMDALDLHYGSAGRIRRDHDHLLRKADLVTCTARLLADEVRAAGVEPFLLPNGVDPARFAPRGSVPADLGPIIARGRPVIGYHGTLARWFDYDLLLAAARARPSWQFVLIGPDDFDDAWDREALAREENIHWLGPRPHDALPDYLAAFDAATIPFRVNAITRACSPIKLFECLAAGLPVAATALDECRGMTGVFVAESTADYLPALEGALRFAARPAIRAALRSEAAAHSWAGRVDALWTRLFGAPLAGSGRAAGPSAGGP